MAKTVKNVTIGQRIKKCAKEKGYNNQYMADNYFYVSLKKVSEKYGGKSPIEIESIKKFANDIGYRTEYFLDPEDNYKTEEEKLKAMKQIDILAYKKTIDYLTTLGFSITPNYFWLLSQTDFAYSYSYMKQYISSEEDDYINDIKRVIKESKYPSEHKDLYLKLKCLPKEIDNIPLLEDITQKESSYWTNTAFYGDNEITILYEIFYNDKLINLIPLNKIQDYLNSFEKTCKNLTLAFLEKDTFFVEQLDLKRRLEE